MKYDHDKLFGALRSTLFTSGFSQQQVDGFNAILNLWEMRPTDFGDSRFLAYAFATVYHETAKTMSPIAEFGRGRDHSYGKPAGPYKKAYYGRGLVQLTWFDNYVKAQIELIDLGIKLDLVRNPDLALSSYGAPQILLYGMVKGWFTGKSLGDYFNHSMSDPVGARHIINGSDRAEDIASYYGDFLAALRGALLT